MRLNGCGEGDAVVVVYTNGSRRLGVISSLSEHLLVLEDLHLGAVSIPVRDIASVTKQD
ncbi:hypothetical protein [Coralloluteibacterium stylophorae]|uniref:Uncharacterized protein n=1 Tax=Coralloluteibacterium stylophorae TaxID=1776034 RepID=A0A8J8AZ64_9GAMM|nr:hypothetical protein [Coralloluteibacterium stylophorae]MBS7457542.1 hypothetical protein [Coralloluteibacterium stylophorae]